ncbi:hypothetical protein COCNU_03G014750 [Cocos nucifera]|uniref:Uncharacterized protein n=1 Tax=Cocos nucifera TaxID=13894 RepID=A0A8K0I4G4_COCNU|nr:hypothetical protein COCNU_03G014750 [Cocos nucifera]
MYTVEEGMGEIRTPGHGSKSENGNGGAEGRRRRRRGPRSGEATRKPSVAIGRQERW